MNKMIKFVDKLAEWGAIIGIGALVVAILMVFFDIAWRRIFSGVFLGSVDITQLCVMTAAFMSIPYAFSRNGHVSVELLDSVMHNRLKKIFELCAVFISMFCMGMIFYLSWARAMEQLSYGDASLNLAIPMILYWFFLLAGCVFSCLVLLAQFVAKTFSLFMTLD